MNLFTLRLRKILLHDSLYYALLAISIIYVIISSLLYKTNNINENNHRFILTIKEIKQIDDKVSFTFKENLIGTYYLKEQKSIKIELGDKIEVRGTLETPSNNTIPNTFNYKKYLHHNNIEYIVKIDEIKVIKKNKNILLKIKNYIIKRISNIKNNEYLYAFILGKSAYIDRETYNNYKINGVTHLFALSGLHVSLFSSIIMFILKKIRINEEISYLLTSIFLLVFSFIASFTPSILRATLFFILSGINNIYYLFIKPKNILYLVLTILIFINPNYIYNTGFILSFTITFFILFFNENFKIKNKIVSILVISIISFLSSLPIIINMNYEINIIGFINNLFFIPYVSYIVFPLSLITFIIPSLSQVLLFLISIMEKISYVSSMILNITLCFSKMNIIEIIIYYILLILIIKRKKYYIIPMTILLILLYLKSPSDSIYYIDVGQGDSTLLVLNNKTILIDTGGKVGTKNIKTNISDNLILFFKSIGIKKINYIITSHGDYDHMGEAINLVNNFKVENVIFNCGDFNDLEKELIIVLEKKKIKYYSCIKELNIDNYKLQFLNTKEYDNENDNSSVIYFNYNNYKFLFMGDAGTQREKDILEKYNLSNIDFLKVGHHGSNTSSSEEFINSINPKYSLISVGKNNRYGHPKESVLDTLSNSKIHRTDLDGSIEIKLNKSGYKIRTCPP